MSSPPEPPTQPIAQAAVLGPGFRVKDRYLIEKELGRGGIGVVYLARDERLRDRSVVLKVLLDKSDASEYLRRKFVDEMAALARTDHPGIVFAVDADTLPDGRPFLVMQHVEGGTLRAAMMSGEIDLRETAEIVRQLGGALTAAHSCGVLHRDLKPENVILRQLPTGEQLATIIDFGIASVRGEGPTREVTQIIGSRPYMAPEQLAGRPSQASDIFALAVIAYEMLVGTLPFKARTIYELPALHRQGLRDMPSTLKAGLPPAIDDILKRALSYDETDRPSSARDLAEELAAALTEPRAPAPEATKITHPKASWKPAAAAALVLAAGLIALEARRRVDSPVAARLSTPADAAVPEMPAAVGARELSYYLTVRSRGKSDAEAFRLPGEMLFRAGDRIRLNVSATDDGYLYVVNEGPISVDGLPMYNLLFPPPALDPGSAGLPKGREIQIPERSWFLMDAEEGVEKVWLIWSADAIPAIESVRKAATPESKGKIQGESRLRGVRDAIAALSRADVRRDDERRVTVVSAREPAFAGLVKLEHH